MKKLYLAILTAMLVVGAPAFAAERGQGEFTIKGDPGMDFRATLVPNECLKEFGGQWTQIDCTPAVEPISLVMGPPLKLESTEHTFNLQAGLDAYYTAFGAAYRIEDYAGVCAYLVEKSKQAVVKCDLIGGAVEY